MSLATGLFEIHFILICRLILITNIFYTKDSLYIARFNGHGSGSPYLSLDKVVILCQETYLPYFPTFIDTLSQISFSDFLLPTCPQNNNVPGIRPWASSLPNLYLPPCELPSLMTFPFRPRAGISPAQTLFLSLDVCI